MCVHYVQCVFLYTTFCIPILAARRLVLFLTQTLLPFIRLVDQLNNTKRKIHAAASICSITELWSCETGHSSWSSNSIRRVLGRETRSFGYFQKPVSEQLSVFSFAGAQRRSTAARDLPVYIAYRRPHRDSYDISHRNTLTLWSP
jgi:hypothetical protein